MALFLIRPELPKWLQEDRSLWPYSKAYSWRYYTKLYWATPPWLTKEMYREMKQIYEKCPDGFHVDHIVPLRNWSLVRGLHVPWNLQYLPAKENMSKGNSFWPDHPLDDKSIIQGMLFDA